MNDKKFILSVENAGGPTQLVLMGKNSGKRLLGSKGSPYKTSIKEWHLSKEELKVLIKDINEVIQGNK